MGINYFYGHFWGELKRSIIEGPPPLLYPYTETEEAIENMNGIIEWVAEMAESYTRFKDEENLEPGESWKEGAYRANGMKKRNLRST